MAYNIISLEDMYEAIGEQKLKMQLNEFECHLNKDVEFFLKEKSIQLLKLGISKTFLVSTLYEEKQVIVGYFSLTNKITKINKSSLSNSLRKRLGRFADISNTSNNYIVSLPLIGQLGKNYKNGYNKLISGDILLQLACKKVKEAQHSDEKSRHQPVFS